ncbi:MAG: AAA family ATPase [Thermoplasmata archaeon]|nr:AAA family ATPase [Thermoplasmata archaeon]
MPEESRRLAAIVLTDLVGFTARTRLDETRALEVLEEHRGIVRSALREHDGREIKTIGDGFLVEFGSAFEAVRAAIRIQELMHDYNAQPRRAQIRARIGVHVGDVVHREGDIYGDCVNQVSRIEPLADPGGVCVSSPVYEQVKHQFREGFVKLDSPASKEGPLPVDVYKILLPWEQGIQLRLGTASLVGRGSDWDTLRSLLDRAAGGEGGVVFVCGEAGIGKSKFAEQGLAYAQRRKMTCLRARCAQKTSAIPYGPWSEMFRELAREATALYLSKIAEGSVEALITLVPELRDKLGPSRTSAALEASADDRRRFIDHLCQVFLNISRDTPLLLFIEDLQFADEGSADLLETIARKARDAALLIVGNARDAEVEESTPFGRLNFVLHADRLNTVISLKRLDRNQVAELIGEILGDSGVSDEFRDMIFGKTGGNPYFVEELLQALIDEGTMFRTGVGWERKPMAQIRLPRTVRELLHQRLARQDEDTLNLLRVASVVGVEFPFGPVREVTALDEERGVNALEHALRARLVNERELGSGRVVYEFGDRQIRDVLYEEISLVRAQRYHRQIAQALERDLETKADELAGEVAYHYLLGNERIKALEFSIRAGDRASRLYAHSEAVRQYTTALDILEEHPDDPVRAQLFEKLGDEEDLLANAKGAVQSWEQAARGYERSGRRIAAGATLVKVAGHLASMLVDRPRSIQVFGEARQMLESETESPELAWLYAQLAAVHSYSSGTSELVQDLCRRAIALGERLKSRSAEISAYSTLSTVLPAHERRKALDLQKKALDIAVLNRSEVLTMDAYSALGFSTIQLDGDCAGALRCQQHALEMATRAAAIGLEMRLRGVQISLVFIRMGRLREARQSSEELYRFAAEHLPRRRWTDLCILGEVLVLQGQLTRAQEVLAEWDSLPKDSVPWYCQARTSSVLAELDLALGRQDSAEKRLETACDLARRQGFAAVHAYDAAKALALLVECRLRRSQQREAEDALQELKRLGDAFDGDVVSGYRLRAEGLWDAARGDRAAAVRHLQQSIVVWERVAWPYEVAQSQFYLGRVYAQSGDTTSAAVAKKQALEGFTRIDAQLGVKRVSAEKEPLQA